MERKDAPNGQLQRIQQQREEKVFHAKQPGNVVLKLLRALRNTHTSTQNSPPKRLRKRSRSDAGGEASLIVQEELPLLPCGGKHEGGQKVAQTEQITRQGREAKAE